MIDDSRDSIDDTPPSSKPDSSGTNPSGRLRWSGSPLVPPKRLVAIGVVALLMVLAGCGGGPTDGTQTPATETDAPPSTVGTDRATETGTDTETTVLSTTTNEAETTTTDGDPEPTTSDLAPTTSDTLATSTPIERAAVDSSPEATGLDVIVEPRTANTTDVGVWVYAAMSSESATEGIESVTVDAGEGLDVSNVSVFDVETAGIDETSNHTGRRTDGPGLGSNVEGGIRTNDAGEGFVVPLDGNRSVDPDDEIVVVLDGGVATTAPGNYTFSLAVNNASAQEDSYNVTGE
ncbi:hypothetical protein [Halococcus agarilyticus]|uniref:hypothetical protein n=1 Tax=Halococcus agarilyticus TaxID=1232219 RepID=UPI0012AB3F89|nr:hypothetical protein [Halococcus agarilyticus]